MLLYSAELRNLSPAVPQGVGVMLDWQAGVLTLQFEDKGKVTGQIIARTKVKDKASLALWLYNGVTSDVYVKDMLGNLTFPKIANSNVVKSSVPEFDVGIYTSGLYRTPEVDHVRVALGFSPNARQFGDLIASCVGVVDAASTGVTFGQGAGFYMYGDTWPVNDATNFVGSQWTNYGNLNQYVPEKVLATFNSKTFTQYLLNSKLPSVPPV